MQVIPAVDVLGGEVVRLRRGDYGRVTRFAADPVAAAAGFVEDGAELVHVVDLEAARSGRGDPALWDALGRAGLPFQAAGGIRGSADARRALDAGAHRVVSGTTAVWDSDALAAIAGAAGGALVAALDVRDGVALGAGWTDRGRSLDDVLAAVGAAGVARVMVTAVAADGMLAGPDLPLVRSMAASAGVPVIASGGVSTPDDLTALAATGAEAAVVGRALYEGRFTLAEAMAAAASAGR